MSSIKLFLTACVLGGVGGASGSVLGRALGPRGLWVGGVIGGLLAAVLVARLAVWRQWIGSQAIGRTAVGAAVGFLAAVAVVTHTLSTPLGPLASTLLIGAGAVLGARIAPQ
ncbi:MAG: hypothetical protein M3068_13735 [Gemmatimonadota bacterium]|nr:hypothetical protein [Gemmatimonadota bacterium]